MKFLKNPFVVTGALAVAIAMSATYIKVPTSVAPDESPSVERESAIVHDSELQNRAEVNETTGTPNNSLSSKKKESFWSFFTSSDESNETSVERGEEVEELAAIPTTNKKRNSVSSSINRIPANQITTKNSKPTTITLANKKKREAPSSGGSPNSSHSYNNSGSRDNYVEPDVAREEKVSATDLVSMDSLLDKTPANLYEPLPASSAERNPAAFLSDSTGSTASETTTTSSSDTDSSSSSASTYVSNFPSSSSSSSTNTTSNSTTTTSSSTSSSGSSIAPAVSGSIPYASVTNVDISSDTLVITGANLDSVTVLKVFNAQNTQVSATNIISKTATKLVASFQSAVSVTLGHAYKIMMTNAYASSTYPITFTIADGTITASMLGDMDADASECLKFDGTIWGPGKCMPDGTAVDQILKWNGSAWALSTVEDLPTGTTSGQVLKWNGSDWVAGTDNTSTGTNGGTVTQITAGTGILVDSVAGGLLTADGTISVDVGTSVGQILKVGSDGDVALARGLKLGDIISTPSAGLIKYSGSDFYGYTGSWKSLTTSEWTSGSPSSIGYTGGNVGIGTTSPSTKLDVVGNAAVSGTFTVGGQSVCLANGTNCPSLGTVSVTPGAGLALSSGNLTVDVDDSTIEINTNEVRLKDSGITNAKIASGALIDFSKLAALSSGNILVGSVGNVATSVAMSGDATISNAGAISIAADSVALSTDTTGNYVLNLTASNGLQATAAAGEGTTPNLVLGGALTAATTITQGTNNFLFDLTSTGTFAVLAGATGLSISNIGITTIASSVLTTTDINGGTIDGTTIGAAVPSTGNFTKIGIGIGAATPSSVLEVLGNVSITGVLSNLVNPTASTDAATKGYVDAGCGMQGAFKNLKIINGTTEDTDIAVTADAECLSDGTRYLRANSVSLNIQSSNAASCTAGTINCLDTGAIANSTWYSIWVISNGTTVAGLLSTSATAPTMPTGYTYKARVGWTRTDGSANLLRTVQYGRRAQYRAIAGVPLPIMASGSVGSPNVPTWVAITISNYVPSTAGVIRGIMVKDINSTMIISANNNTGEYNSGSNPSPGGSSSSNNNMRMPFEFLIEVANTIYWASDHASNEVAAFGWEDNL